MKNLLSLIGFAAAGYFFLAWMGKNNTTGSLDNLLLSDRTEVAEAGVFDAPRTLEAPNEVSRNNLNTRHETPDDSRMIASAMETNTGVATSEIQSAVRNLSDRAIAAAMDADKHIPAGASLALLVYSAERGKQLTTSNLKRVIEYLESVKANADESDVRKYFKYSSNSEKWFEGLEQERNGGHPVAELQRIYRSYNLKQYDKGVYAAVINPTSRLEIQERVAPKSEAPELPAMEGDAPMEDVRKNHAYAVNRWADKESKGTRAEVKILPAKALDSETGNAAHRQVAKLSVGESMTFGNPEAYHAAVKEMIALENEYNSWTAYQDAVGKDKARRTFHKRSEKGGFLATGTLKVTREK